MTPLLLAFLLGPPEFAAPRLHPSPVAVERYIRYVASEQGVDPDFAVCLATKESGLDPDALGPTDDASVFQFQKTTFGETRHRMGVKNWTTGQRWNPKINIETAIWKLRHDGPRAWVAYDLNWCGEPKPVIE